MSKRTKKPKIIMRSTVAAAAKFGLGIAVAVACGVVAALGAKLAGATADWWVIGPFLSWLFGSLLLKVCIGVAVIGLLTVTYSFLVFGDWCPVTHQDFDKSNNDEQYPDSNGKPVPED